MYFVQIKKREYLFTCYTMNKLNLIAIFTEVKGKFRKLKTISIGDNSNPYILYFDNNIVFSNSK